MHRTKTLIIGPTFCLKHDAYLILKPEFVPRLICALG